MPEYVVPAELTPNFAELLYRSAERWPTRPLIEEADSVVSFRELAEEATRVASGLRARGLRSGDRVGILLDRSARAAAAFFGVLAGGGVAVIINETLRPRQIEHILDKSSAAFLISDDALLNRQPRGIEMAGSAVRVEELRATPTISDRPVPRIGQDPAQIIFTSGSTGLPKGVTISHANMWAGMRAVVSYVGITEEDRIASLLPFSFDYGLNQLYCAVGAGAALVIERSPLPQQISATLAAKQVTVLPAVPPLWLQLINTPSFIEKPLPALRAMTNTGGRIPTDGVRRLRQAHPHAQMFLMYGLTEAFRACYLSPAEVDRRPDSIGRAIPGCEIMVLREDLTPCAPNEVGELVQRGATVTLGYWGDPEATAKVFRPNPLSPPGTPAAERVVFSGDLVRMDENGFIYFVGRRDTMLKSMGFRVSPDEIANVLYDSGEIVEGVVTAESDELRGNRIVAHVVLKGGGSLERLWSFCRVELPRYMHPAEILTHTSLPRTSSGKHDSLSLRDALAP